MLQLKRFDFHHMGKVNRHIQFDEHIDITKYCSPKATGGSSIYQLYAGPAFFLLRVAVDLAAS